MVEKATVAMLLLGTVNQGDWLRDGALVPFARNKNTSRGRTGDQSPQITRERKRGAGNRETSKRPRPRWRAKSTPCPEPDDSHTRVTPTLYTPLLPQSCI